MNAVVDQESSVPSPTGTSPAFAAVGYDRTSEILMATFVVVLMAISQVTGALRPSAYFA